MVFQNRQSAGKELAPLLSEYEGERTVVVALPRGGVPVATEIAKELGATLNIIVSKKIGAPGYDEFAIGATCEGGEVWLNQKVIKRLKLDDKEVQSRIEKKKTEVESLVQLYRKKQPFPDVSGKTVILVDDGIATGATAMVAVESLKARGVKRLILASPVVSGDSANNLRQFTDKVVSVVETDSLGAVGEWYKDFSQLTDAEVTSLLASQ